MAIVFSSKKAPKRKLLLFFITFLILVVAIFGLFYFLKTRPKEVRPAYVQLYRLVPEKLSQSAKIPIYLPPGIDEAYAKKHIKFTPELKGRWVSQKNWFFPTVFAAQSRKVLYFQPQEKPKLNHYYLVELSTPQGVIKDDFLVVEDPKIIAVFPKENSEAPEDSEITIVFNRPMVPLTTLGYLEKKNVPVEIFPKTEGRFKWITTNTLQFIPKERLFRSTKYRVKIGPMVSVDGLKAQGKQFEFFTRRLRYLHLTKGLIIYNQPISIHFNQPVDLEKTKREIHLIESSSGKEIPFIAEYKKIEENKPSNSSLLGEAKTFLAGLFFPKKEKVDKTTIEIYNQRDKFGRKKFWDFEKGYNLIINKAYPLEGDIVLDQTQETYVQIAGPIKNISASSDKTNFAAPDYFDPQGKLWVDFYEEIDLSKTKIKSDKLKDIGYGQKCQDKKCEPDKKRIYLTFDSQRIQPQERIQITFEKIVNVDGLKINEYPIIRNIFSYPKFRILRTFPEDGSQNANLTKIIICSNSQILKPAKEDYEKYIQSNLDFELKYWWESWRVQGYYDEDCHIGEFQTEIEYGLMPFSDYTLNLKLEDVFGQHLDYSLSFRTGAMPSKHIDFYHLQRRYNVTTPTRTRLTYAAKNMDYVNLQICKLGPKEFLRYLEEGLDFFEPTPTYICQNVVYDKIELPKRYWIKNYFKVDIKNYFPNPLGHYILTFYNPEYKKTYWEYGESTKKQAFERTYLTVTNLSVAEKRISPLLQYNYYGRREPLPSKELEKLQNLYWVINFSDLSPVEGAKIDLYKGKGLYLAGSYFTNREGIAFAKVIPNLTGVIVSKGSDSTVIPEYESNLDWAEEAYSAKKIYLYTDKPIYRPGQEVFIKGIYRIGYDGNYQIERNKKINLKIYNPRRDEVFSQDLDISDFGTFNTKFILEEGAPLGTWRICAESYHCIPIDVQEYVPAPFKVTLKTDKDEYISKDTLNLKILASYYFGVPLEGGEVEYTISSQNYYFDRYHDGYFNFDSEWYYWPPFHYGDKFILRGKASLNKKGEATISQTLDLDKLFPKEERKSKIIVVDVTVKNSAGQSVSAQKSFILHAGEFYLGLRPERYFVGRDEKFNLKVKSVDTQGKEVSIRNAKLNLYKIDWIYAKRQEAGGGYSYIWQEKRDLIKSIPFSTDLEGNFETQLQISKEGEYEIEAVAKDKRGNIISSKHSLYVFGPAHVRVRPTNDTKLEIEAEKTELNVGDKAKVIIKSPYPKAKALISIERGKIYEYQIREIQSNLYPFSFEIKKEYLPNVYLSVLLVSPKPEIKFGKVEFKIDRSLKKINVEIKSNKKFYLPGEKVSLDILTKDSKNNPVSADVSVAVVDASVLALKGNPKKNPLIFFYSGFPLAVTTASNLKHILEEVKVITKGGGGMAPEALAIKKRGIFKETALWQARVITDKQGRAHVEFNLPDNLTTWQTEVLGVTKDTKLGVGYLEFTTKKNLMVVPLKPRFIVPGDEFFIGAQIFNQTKETRKIKVKFESQTLIIQDKQEKEVSILPQQSKIIYFKVQAPAQILSGEHIFSILAKSGEFQDWVETRIKITPNNTYEVVASSNYTDLPVFKEYVFLPDNVERDRGELKIKSSASLAVFLSDALNSLLEFPYGCSEQVASKLNAIAIVKRGLNLENIQEKFHLKEVEYKGKKYDIEDLVAIGLAKLYNNQNFDGGFSFWGRGKSDFSLTLYVVEAMHNLSLAGFSVDQHSFNRALDFIYREITTNPRIYKNKNNIISAAYELMKFPAFNKNPFLREKIIEIINDDFFLQEKINNVSLAKLAILLNWGFEPKIKEKVYKILDNRIDIDGRGAFLGGRKNLLWEYYETPIKDTALYLKAKVAAKLNDPILAKVLRWLLNSRSKDGGWGSTQNTISVIDAFVDFLEWKQETRSHFTLQYSINGQPDGSFEFGKETIFDQFEKEVPLKHLKFNQNNEITFTKQNLNKLKNAYYYDLSLKYYLPAEKIPPRDEGFTIIRNFYRLDDSKNQHPVFKAKVGEVLREHLKIIVPKDRYFVAVEDFIPAGMEIVNLDLATEQKSLRLQDKEFKWQEFHPDFKEIHNDRAFLYKRHLPPGVYEFDYYVRALIKGKFVHLPAQIFQMYFPEVFGRTDSGYFVIE